MMYALRVYSLGGGWYAKLNVYGHVHVLPYGQTYWLPCSMSVEAVQEFRLVAKNVVFK